MIFWLNERESHDELRLAGTGFHTDSSVMAVDDDAVNDLEPESGALAGSFRRKKRLEKVVANVRWNARAIVLNDDHGLVTFPARGYGENAGIMHGIEGV